MYLLASHRGAPFDIYIMRKRKGRQVPVKQTLWRASGKAPIIHGRHAERVTGARHALRPSAERNSKVPSQSEMSSCEISEWAGQDELPFETCAEDVGWLPGPVGGSGGRDRPAFLGRGMAIRVVLALMHSLKKKPFCGQLIDE